MSERRLSNSEFWQTGLDVRILKSARGLGFVVRFIDGSGPDAKIRTVARQPGHGTMVATSQDVEYVRYPHALDVQDRYYGVGQPVPESPDVTIERLNAEDSQTE